MQLRSHGVFTLPVTTKHKNSRTLLQSNKFLSNFIFNSIYLIFTCIFMKQIFMTCDVSQF